MREPSKKEILAALDGISVFEAKNINLVVQKMAELCEVDFNQLDTAAYESLYSAAWHTYGRANQWKK